MALDRQKILNELGSVVNQLQSADCGCMGKIFSNSDQRNSNAGHLSNDYNGGMRSCCGHHGHHGYNAPCAGEPCSGAHHCMGFCNPPKLYADTYSYLNQNMMQPVVQEVYEDLKSISPANTLMNNPMAAQMGLSQKSNSNPDHMMNGNIRLGADNCNHHSHPPNLPHFGNTQMNPSYNDNSYFVQNNQQQRTREMQQTIGQPEQAVGQMGQNFGQIGQGVTQMGQSEIGQGMDQMGQGMAQFGQGMNQRGNAMREMRQGMAPGMGAQIVNMMNSNIKKNYRPDQGNIPNNSVSNSLETGLAVSNVTSDAKANPYESSNLHNNAGYMGMNNMHSGNNLAGTPSHISPPNVADNMRKYNQVGNTGANSQINSTNPYGQHSAGVSKFNEMFPGVMKGDLGFDPMAIAIQMNPANQQRSAMDSMQKMMMGNASGIGKIIGSSGMQPVLNATNAVTPSLVQPSQQMDDQSIEKQNIQQQQQNIHADSVQSNETVQRVNNMVTGSANMVQQEVFNPRYLQQSPSQTRQTLNQPLVGLLPTVPEDLKVINPQKPFSENVVQPATPSQRIYKEPILPANTSRDQLQSHHFMKAPTYDYNTIGQPVQMISPANYQTVESVLPQTISGQVVPTKKNMEPMKFNNVKATVSKTQIVGTRPTGNTPSRSQLHHLYNQYKGSQSFTQQNIRQADFTGSNSEGRMNVPQINTPIAQYIERVGGDTVANDEIHVAAKEELNVNDIGDIPRAKKQPDDSIMTRARNSKTRNGLQDQVFSSIPTSAKWSFHGSTPVPYSVGYRFKIK